MAFIFFNIFILFIIFFLLIVLSMIWPPDSPWAPWWKTDKNTSRKICEMANINSKDVVYELGSGDATFLITCAKDFKAHGIGFEIDPFRSLFSKVMLYFNGVSDKIKIERTNFFEADLSKATVVFVYLVPKTLEKLKQKFLKELKPETKIISFRYKMNLPIIKEDKINKIYLYQI